MHNLRQHIVFRLSAIILVATLFTPSAVKFAHIFEHHEHVVCIGGDDTHIHQVDLDCDFQKFQVNQNLAFTEFEFNIFEDKEIRPEIASQYSFLSEYQRLHFALRGPPQINLA